MKKLIYILSSLLVSVFMVKAQETIYPAKEYKGLLFIKNATVHIGNGQVLQNTTIKVNNGKIEQIGQNIAIPADDVKVFDASNKQVYPGLILPTSELGLKEINSGVKGSNDYAEIGEMNPNVRAIVAYNTDSKITATVRSNGVLLANITPRGGWLAPTSSVVQLDAWNYEDAAYRIDGNHNFYMPSLLPRPAGRRFTAASQQDQPDPVKQALDQIENVKKFFREAKAYFAEATHKETNLKFESVKGLFDKKQKLFIHCNQVKQILLAIDFVKEFGFDVVIVGGSDSWQLADLLKQNNMAVILSQQFNLPTLDDDDVDQPYKTAAVLQKAGVLYCINDDDNYSRGRNLAFNAGNAAAYGLTKEEALTAITLNTARILGIDDRTGSIEVGKDANIIICEGDLLDMKSSVVIKAFIQGREINLDNKQKQLYEKYKYKYGLK
jgi:imidazolonepropionase-like amidohydrolase